MGTKTLSMRLGVGYRTAEVLLWPWMMALTRRDWHGQAHLGAHGQGIVVAPNHISFFDPLVMAHFLHDSGRPPQFMGKQAVFDVPMVGQLLSSTGQIPVTRDKDPHIALAAAETAIRAGGCVVMYPEGTITRDPDIWPMSGRTGALRLALDTGAPLIPVAQWGAHKVMAPYSKQMRLLPPKLLQVTAGPPVDVDDLRDRLITRALLKQGTDRLMDAITALLADIRGEVPPAQRLDWVAEQRNQARATEEEN